LKWGVTLKITIEEGNQNQELEVIIKCNKINEDVEKLATIIQLHSHSIVGKWESETVFLKLEEVLYFDTADDKVFIYTKKRVYETNLRLYEIEEKFEATSVIRVNKSTILNLMKVERVAPMLNGRIKAELENGELLIISRQYVPNFKKKLGIGVGRSYER
jgi:DNA-binding LytR/AlgR family response regulator